MILLVVCVYLTIGLLAVAHRGKNLKPRCTTCDYYQEKDRQAAELIDLLVVFYFWPFYIVNNKIKTFKNKKDEYCKDKC